MSAAPATIRVLIIDDSTLVREGLRVVLSTAGSGRRVEVVGEAGSVGAGVEAARNLKPDVVLLDVRLPDGSGVDACRQILARCPDSRILMLTSVVDDATVMEAIRAGAHGYLLKEIDRQSLMTAVQDVSIGKSFLDPAITGRVMQMARNREPAADPLRMLSPQEKRIVALIAEGCTNKEAAQKIGLSEKTVKNYLSTVFEKLNVSSRAQAAALYAKETGNTARANQP